MLIQTKQIEPIPNSALVSDAKIGSLSSLPFSASSCTDAISQLYTSLHNLSFLSLTDTPNSYSGQGYKFARVNNTETALQFSSIRENNSGNVGIGYSGLMSSLATKLYIDDSSPSVDYGIFVNKNYGFTALTVNAGAGATGLDVGVDGAGGDILRLSGQYSPAIVAKYSGRLGIGTSSPGYRLHTAWRSGDTATTAYFGANTTGNNQVGLDAETYNATAALRANNANGSYGLQGISSASGSFGVYGQSLTAGGVKASGQVYGAWLESAGTSLYVYNGTIQFAPLSGTGTRMVTANSSGVIGTQSVPVSGITSLNALTGTSQTFTNDTNVTINSVGTTHTLGWSGNLAITRGGTNATTANAALNNLLPSQTANAGKYLCTDGTNSSWKNFPRPSQTRFVSAGFSGLSAPYYTSIQAAIDDAASGDLVEVFAGTYNEHLTLKDSVNLYIHTGVRVRYAGTMYHTVYANNVNCTIDGFGIFEHDAANSLSVISIEGTSNITLRCQRLHMIAGYQAIVMIGSGRAVIEANEILGNENVDLIRVADGTLELSVRTIQQSLDGIPVLLQTGGSIRIVNTYIEGSYDAAPGAITSRSGILNKEAGRLILSNCTLVNRSNYTPAYSIGSPSAQDVIAYHCVANKAAHANINVTVQNLVVDSDVS